VARDDRLRVDAGRQRAGLQPRVVEEPLQNLRRTAERVQDVKRHDVARALPDRGQRRLAVQARHAGLLHVAVAAEAFEGLDEREVVGEQVAVRKRRDLLGDIVGQKRGDGFAPVVGHPRKSSNPLNAEV